MLVYIKDLYKTLAESYETLQLTGDRVPPVRDFISCKLKKISKKIHYLIIEPIRVKINNFYFC